MQYILLKYSYLYRLSGIAYDSKDLEYTRLAHFNKGLTLLAETLKSDTTHLKGKHSYLIIMITNKSVCFYSGYSLLAGYMALLELLHVLKCICIIL